MVMHLKALASIIPAYVLTLAVWTLKRKTKMVPWASLFVSYFIF